MGYLLYLIFRCDRRCDGCDGKFGNLVGTKHTLGQFPLLSQEIILIPYMSLAPHVIDTKNSPTCHSGAHKR